MLTEKRKIFECTRCGWVWIAEEGIVPKTCARCCSPYYNKPYATTRHGKPWAPHKRKKGRKWDPEVVERRNLFQRLYDSKLDEAEVPLYYCRRCSNKWMPRNYDKKPRVCPRCGSMYYDRPYKIGPSTLRKYKLTSNGKAFMKTMKKEEEKLVNLQEEIRKATRGIKIGIPRPKNLPRGRYPRGFGEKMRVIANRPYMQELLKAFRPIFAGTSLTRKQVMEFLPEKLTPPEKGWLSRQLVK